MRLLHLLWTLTAISKVQRITPKFWLERNKDPYIYLLLWFVFIWLCWEKSTIMAFTSGGSRVKAHVEENGGCCVWILYGGERVMWFNVWTLAGPLNSGNEKAEVALIRSEPRWLLYECIQMCAHRPVLVTAVVFCRTGVYKHGGTRAVHHLHGAGEAC